MSYKSCSSFSKVIFFVRALSCFLSTCFPLAVALWASIVLHHALVLLTSPNQQACYWTHLSLGLTPLLTKSTVDLSSQLPPPHYRPSITQTHRRLFHSIAWHPPFNPDHQSHHKPWSWFWMQLNCVSMNRRSGYSWLPHNMMHIMTQVSTHCHAWQMDLSWNCIRQVKKRCCILAREWIFRIRLTCTPLSSCIVPQKWL